tara:strand:+ start:13580 stop:13762 length:183 start_codon:yes stop_codon:yes gene_type:complete
MQKHVLTIPEFSQMYGLNEATVRVDVTRAPEKLPAILRIGRSIRFTLEAIKEWEVVMTKS